MKSDIYISEIYGPVFQGEGLTIGRPCAFVRLAGCNLTCKWCDSKYTWDWKAFRKEDEVHKVGMYDVFNRVITMNVNRVVITGGEPFLQQDILIPLCEEFNKKKIIIEVETAGSIVMKGDFADQYNVSPKLGHSGNNPDKAINKKALYGLIDTKKANFKFVVTEKSFIDDFKQIDGLVERFALSPVLIMPEGMDAETIIRTSRAIAAETTKRGYFLTTRLHTLLYGSRRGV